MKTFDDLKNKILNATEVPFEGKGFYSGFVLLAGGPGIGPFEAIFAPIAS